MQETSQSVMFHSINRRTTYMKMNKKLLLLLLPILMLASCGQNKEKDDSVVLLNGYETVSDMYRSKLVYPFNNYNMQCSFEINNDTTYVKEGSGSLKMNMVRADSGDYSYFVQRFSESDAKDRNIADIDKFSLWLYNSNDVETKVSLALVAKGDVVFTNQDFSLAANSWNYLEYNLSRLIVETSYEDLVGFGVLINETNGTYYLDDWKVYFGANYTDDDLAILDVINTLNDKVALLNKNMKFTDATEIAKLEEACTLYYQIDSAYRSAVKGVNDLLELAEGYTDYLSQNSDPVKAFNFANPAGVVQANVSLISSGGVSLSYSTDIKRANTNGSMKVSANGSTKWTYLDLTTSITLSDYSKFGFWFYNDSDTEFGFCVQWNGTAQYIKPKGFITDNDGWQYIEYSCAGLSSKVEFEYCAVADGVSGGVLDTKGDIYISDVTVFK